MLLWAVWRWARKWLASILWVTLAVSFSLSVWGVEVKPTPTFYLLPTRAWELLLGAVLALELVRKPNAAWQRELAAAAGVLAIIAAMTLYTRDSKFPGVAALMPSVGAALVIWAGVGSATWTGRALASPIPVLIGVISYSLYLWHWPLIVFAQHLTNGRLNPFHQFVLACTATGFALLTWRFVEKPLRAGGWPWPTPRLRFAFSGLALLALVLVGAGMKLGQGFPERMSPLERELVAKKDDFSPLRARCHSDGSARTSFAKTCVLGDSISPKIIVFADSHGAELSVALKELASRRHASVRQVTASGCPPAGGFNTQQRPECSVYVDVMLRGLLELPPSTVVITAYYFDWSRGNNGSNFWNGFSSTVQSLRSVGHSVLLLGAVPPHPGGISVPSALARWVFHGGALDDYRFKLDRRAASEIDLHLKRIANETGAIYIPMVPYFCPDDGGCQGFKNGTVMYFDDNHMSVSGARRVAADLLVPLIWPKHARHVTP